MAEQPRPEAAVQEEDRDIVDEVDLEVRLEEIGRQEDKRQEDNVQTVYVQEVERQEVEGQEVERQEVRQVTETTEVERFDTDIEVGAAVAERVVRILTEALEERGTASVVLTGGGIARKIHADLAVEPEQVDWSQVDVWWGDERFVPADDPERNAGQAREDFLDHVGVTAERVHEMPGSDDFADVARAASAFADELRAGMANRTQDEPWFDVLMLGIGPDGHCASLFPGRPEVSSEDDVLPVEDSPKPPPQRITLGMSVLQRARHVIFAATGEEKAEAVAASVRGIDVLDHPSAGPRGVESTTWYVDAEAATHVV